MTELEHASRSHPVPGVSPGYAGFQLAKALGTTDTHSDPETRERARKRAARWEAIIRNLSDGSVAYGSRTPLRGVPAWATPEVVTGGFVTGELLAAGPLEAHERARLESLPPVTKGNERLALNTFFLTDAGLVELRERLRSGRYEVEVPEETVLLMVAWLADNGHTNEALELVDNLSPWFGNLRFYPAPSDQAKQLGTRMHVQNVERTQKDLRAVRERTRILAQKEAVEVWAPLYDRLVALLLETVEEDRPCRRIPPDWSTRAKALLADYAALRQVHRLCGKPDRAKHSFARLRGVLSRCADDPATLSEGEISQARHMLKQYVDKRGHPDGQSCTANRARQRRDVSGPSFKAIAEVVAARLDSHPAGGGVDDTAPLVQPIHIDEASGTGVPEGTHVPEAIRRKVERCLHDTAAVLIDRGLISSGEAFAHVLPQMTSGLRAAGMADPALRRLYAATYRAFRRRRSLLLLDLQKQVQIEELPWVAAMERFRSRDLSGRDLCRQTLEEASSLTLVAFPYAIVPNKLLQELRALARGADVNLPLVDELAADIFMGRFSNKFIASAHCAAEILDGTLYATYYGIDVSEVRQLKAAAAAKRRTWLRWSAPPETDGLAQLCATRAGVALGTWVPVANGMLIEQQQIITTQNLATLFVRLGLAAALREQLDPMARRCFAWICKRQQMKIDEHHGRLIMLKNTAYAWRQMIFFLAQLPSAQVAAFLRWAHEHLEAQQDAFRQRFRPALTGLELAAEGVSLDVPREGSPPARRFLGWSQEPHWLLPPR